MLVPTYDIQKLYACDLQFCFVLKNIWSPTSHTDVFAMAAIIKNIDCKVLKLTVYIVLPSFFFFFFFCNTVYQGGGYTVYQGGLPSPCELENKNPRYM